MIESNDYSNWIISKRACDLIELKDCLATGRFENQIYLIQT